VKKDLSFCEGFPKKQTQGLGDTTGLDTIADLELAIDLFHMGFDGIDGDY